MDRVTAADEVVRFMFDGHEIVVRRWFDTGNISVWRRWSESYYAMMKDMARRHGGWFCPTEQYESWYFLGSVATTVIGEIRAACAGRP